MKATVGRILAATALSVAAPLAANAAELYSPPLAAQGSQFFECVIVNVSGSPQTVTTEAFNSNGVSSSGPLTETLAPGHTGGFSLSAVYASFYCKFTVSGVAKHYRADVTVIDTRPDGTTYVVAALPAK